MGSWVSVVTKMPFAKQDASLTLFINFSIVAHKSVMFDFISGVFLTSFEVFGKRSNTV